MNVYEIDNICGKCTNSDELPDKNLLKRWESIKLYQNQLKKLIQKPIIQQKTQEWYDIRNNMITASDFAQALGKGKFGTTKDFYKKKCDPSFKDTFNPDNEYFKWGIMFEPVAISIYKDIYNTDIYEFGLIKDDNESFIGASPDGITSNGIMIEIKCPKKRIIKPNDIPLQYYYQVMGQLKVCGLYECDYFECKFQETTLENLKNIEEATKINDNSKTSKKYFGAIIEIEPHKYMYSDINITLEELVNWVNFNENVIYWYFEKYNIVRVVRDEDFIDNSINKLKDVWKNINAYRTNPELLKTNVILPTYSFVD